MARRASCRISRTPRVLARKLRVSSLETVVAFNHSIHKENERIDDSSDGVLGLLSVNKSRALSGTATPRLDIDRCECAREP